MSNPAREKSITPLSLEIHLLGPFRVVVDGRMVEERQWPRPRPKLLIKLLALQPHHQLDREQVMELLWPEQEPESASNNLNKAIHMARRALEPELRSAAASHFILTHDQQIVLHAPDRLWVDIEAFEQAAMEAIKGEEVEAYEAALALYSGDLLAEDLYEDWAASRRERLRNSYQELLIRLARLYETRGQYQQSIERFKELVEREPSNEEAHRHLMRLYAATRSRRLALRQYEECREALHTDLDVEPERATVELKDQIIAGHIRPLRDVEVRSQQHGAAINSLAILPLVNAGGDPNSEYLSDGITESIINTLSQLPQLRVTARSTVFRYKGSEIDPQEVGSRLGVRAVMTGRVLQRGDRLNIQAELVDVSDGSQLWGEQYNRKSSGIFELQEEIAQEITGKLRLRLSGEEKGRLIKRYTENTAAYQLYLKGRYHWNKRTEEGINKGIECFQQALKIDPNYALAYAGISDCYAFLGDVGLTAVPSKEAFSKAKQAALRALEIDETLAEAYTSLAHTNMHCFEWSDAEIGFKRAIELSPNHVTTHEWYAFYLVFNGRVDEAITEVKRALELDPLSLSAHQGVGSIFLLARQYDQAIEQYRNALELDSNYYRAYLWLGWAYEQKGMYEEASRSFLKATMLSEDNPDALAALGRAAALSGKRGKALDVLKQLRELSARSYVSPYDMSLLLLSLGEKEQAFEWLEKAYEERAEWMIYLSVDPRFDSLRAEGRFKDLLRRIGFPS